MQGSINGPGQAEPVEVVEPEPGGDPDAERGAEAARKLAPRAAARHTKGTIHPVPCAAVQRTHRAVRSYPSGQGALRRLRSRIDTGPPRSLPSTSPSASRRAPRTPTTPR